MEIRRKYGTETKILFPLVTFGADDFLTGATLASGDATISKDEGTFASTTNTIVEEGNGFYSLTLSSTEMEAARICIAIVDQTDPKEWVDTGTVIVTEGNASAQFAFDSDQAVPAVNATQIEGSDATNQINAACDTALADYDAPTKAELDSGLAALNDLDAAGIRTAVGLASADLDTQLGTIVADTNELQTNQGNWLTATGFSTHDAAAVVTAMQAAADDFKADVSGLATAAALATVDSNVDAILVDTAVIGAAGAGLTAIPWNAAWDAQVQSEVTDALNAYDPPTKAELDSGFAGLNDPTAGAIADAVLNEALSGHTTAGTLGKAIADIETDVTAILVDTNELQTNQGDWATADVSGLATASALSTMQGNVTSILADTGELQTNQDNWLTADVSGLATTAALATVDSNIDAIKVTTDKLDDTLEDDSGTYRFTVNALEQAPSGGGGGGGLSLTDSLTSGDTINEALSRLTDIDSNVSSVLTDTGTTLPAQISGLNNLSSADVNAACDTALADYDGPTNAEMAAAIGALNDVSAADILTQATAALTSYDPPTKAELDSAVSPLATAAALSTVDANVDAILVDTGTTIPAQITALNDISASDLLTATVESTLTVQQSLQLMNAALHGKVSGAGTGTITIRNIADDADRIVATVDTDGNRSSVTRSVS